MSPKFSGQPEFPFEGEMPKHGDQAKPKPPELKPHVTEGDLFSEMAASGETQTAVEAREKLMEQLREQYGGTEISWVRVGEKNGATYLEILLSPTASKETRAGIEKIKTFGNYKVTSAVGKWLPPLI